MGLYRPKYTIIDKKIKSPTFRLPKTKKRLALKKRLAHLPEKNKDLIDVINRSEALKGKIGVPSVRTPKSPLSSALERARSRFGSTGKKSKKVKRMKAEVTGSIDLMSKDGDLLVSAGSLTVEKKSHRKVKSMVDFEKMIGR